MDYKEEQDGEIEAVRSIYTEEEFKELSSSPWIFEITVSSELNGNKAHCVIQFELPDQYPDVIPIIILLSHSSNIDPTHIQQLLQEQAEDNLGTPMIYTLTSSVQDKLLEVLDGFEQEAERELREKEEEAKRKEEEKYKGTIVTMETFMAWKKQFMKEKERIRTTTTTAVKLTGKQMFERDASLALSDARFLTEVDEEFTIEDNVEVDESLFQDLGDLENDEGIS